MTEKSVVISITIKAFEKEKEYKREVRVEEMEGEISRIVQGIGQEVLRAGIEEMDKRISEEVPKRWRNVGTEERGVLSSLGAIRYRRRIYMDETGIRRKPIDEVLGVERYGRDSQTVREMGAYLACEGTYRRAASQLSWLVKAAVSHSTIQRMVWQVGKRIADGEEAERERVFGIGERIEKGKVKVPVLYGESDGVWLHLQREGKKSVEVRVATLYSGKKLIGKKRYGLENKCVVTSIGETSAAWQEHLLWKAHRYYDLETVQLLITGGDGNQWVRRSFDRFDIKQEFVLDRFHLTRAACRAIQHRETAREIVKELRQSGFSGMDRKLKEMIDRASGKKEEKLKQFYKYIYHQQDGLLDLERRGYPASASLGAIEGNVDKLVVHRMKGRGCCWKLTGARAMLAICQYKNKIRDHAFRYQSLDLPEKPSRRLEIYTDMGVYLQTTMPIFYGPDQDKPWVRSLYRYVHYR